MGGNKREANSIGWGEDLHVGPKNPPHNLLDVPSGGSKGGSGCEEVSKGRRGEGIKLGARAGFGPRERRGEWAKAGWFGPQITSQHIASHRIASHRIASHHRIKTSPAKDIARIPDKTEDEGICRHLCPGPPTKSGSREIAVHQEDPL